MLLSILCVAQVSFTVVAPASIAGGYEFTSNGDGPNWGLPNLDDPNDAVLDTVVLADDGTPGINAQGIPFANEACAPLVNDLTGKIAMVYRYDGSSSNVCYVGTKVLNAQNAGAVGVIVVNREETVIGYGGTTDGPSTNIPFAFISKSDGALIRAKIDAGEDVVAFIGNKLGLHMDDVGINKKNTLVPTKSAVLSQLSQNGTEFGFDIGSKIYNFGQNDQNNVMITATVNGPAGTWTETAGPFTILSGDSVDVVTGGLNNIPAFSNSNYPDGIYTLDYDLSIGVTDEEEFDNHLSYQFMVSDSIMSYAKIDPNTNMPQFNTYTRSADPGFKACMVLQEPNADRIGIKGLHVAATMAWDAVSPLDGESVDVYLYKWNDVFTDLNDPAFAFDFLEDIAYGNYEFVNGDDSNSVYIPLEEPVVLENGQRYLTCVEVYNDEIWLGYNNRVDYTRNIDRYLQPLVPSGANSNYFAFGFGRHQTPAIALSVFDADELTVREEENLKAKVFPNPSADVLNVSIPDFSSGELMIRDLSGRLVQQISVQSAISQIEISDLSPGHYIITIQRYDGLTGQYPFVKI